MSSFCKENTEWTLNCGNLRPTKWHPYSQENYNSSCGYNNTAGYGINPHHQYGKGGGNPYNKLGGPIEGYYNSVSHGWTKHGNVTSHNRHVKYPHTKLKKNKKVKGGKENYDCCGAYKSGGTNYSLLGNYWDFQSRYSL